MKTIHTRELTSEQIDAVADLAGAVQDHDCVEALSEDTMLTLSRPGLERLLRTDPQGNIVGFAQINDGSAELAVDPAHRRRGHGEELLHEILRTDPDARVWAHGDLPPARSLAVSNGLVQVRDLWVMSRVPPTPEQAPPVQSPPGVRIRNFVVGADEQAWLDVNARAFADHPEQGRTTMADLEARFAQPWFDPDGFWLAVDDESGDLLASMWTKITGPQTGAGGPGPRVGEIYVLAVDPDAQGRGLGSVLTRVAMHAFARIGLDRLELYVEGENTAAIAVYRRSGFERSAVHVQYARPNSPDASGMPR